MPRATWLADVLTDAGLKVKPFPGWETRGGTLFNPVGIILHHTVTKPTTADAVIDRFLATTGSSTTPAPLCNYSTNRDGTVSLIAAGTANHGGKGSWQGVSGNSRFFGDEMKNLGTKVEPWPARQLDSARTAAAAILTHLGKTNAGMVCGHKEYAIPWGRKSDPHSLIMSAERARITALMEDEDMPWNKPGDSVLDLNDADAVFEYQGSFAPGPNQASYNPGGLDEANDRLWIVLARLADWAMRNAK